MRTTKLTAVLILCAGPLLGASAGSAAPGSAVAPKPAHATGAGFAVSFPAQRSATPLDGRIILLVSRDLTREPRSHVSPDEPLASPYIFGLNVEGMAGGQAVVIDDRAFGWPARKLSRVPAGDYLVQAVLNRYETFHLARRADAEAAAGQGRGTAMGAQARQPVFEAAEAAHRSGAPAEHGAGHSTRRSRPISPKTDTEFVRHVRIRASCCPSSGAATCTWARTCCCRRASTRTRRRTIR